MKIHFHPRRETTWQSFVETTPPGSIALDGYVTNGPAWCESTLHANFDHHTGCVREATMSSAMQVYFAIKGGLCSRIKDIEVYVNDIDQDTAMAIWLLRNHHLFEGPASIPSIGRILTINDRFDITGGSFPTNLADDTYYQHCWVFQPYTEMRKAGEIATASVATMRTLLESIEARLDALLMGKAQLYQPSTKYEILASTEKITVVDEIDGIEARHHLFAAGLIKNAYLSIVARRDGRTVYTIGRRSRYVDFDLPSKYPLLNKAETIGKGWGGSDIIGGSDRMHASGLTWQQVLEVVS